MKRDLKFETLQLHSGQETPDPATDARAVPIYQTTSYVFRNCQHAADRFSLEEAGNIYGRLTNPTQEVFETRIAALEGGSAALAVASGAAAITYTFQNLAKAGDHIVASKYIYGGSYNLLEHTLKDQGIETTFVDPDEEPPSPARPRRCISSPSAIRTQILQISEALPRLPMPMVSRLLWTIPLPRRICSDRLSMELILSYILPLSLSAGTEQLWVE